jgi:acid phosphatase (class A)
MRCSPILPLAALLVIAADAPPGYLGANTIDIAQIVPPPPQKGDIRYATDRKVFRATRAMLATPRGTLAIADVPASVPAMMGDFSCAAGVALSPQATPATFRLLAGASADTGRANNRAKDMWQRQRPFLIDRGPVCEDKAELAKSYDYPSGHTTRGWTFGLILSELLPDRATPILTRARAYGESRIVCGAHNMSAIEAGRLGATVTMAAVRATAGYQADVAAAKAELAAATIGSAAGMCASEAALTRDSVLSALRK